MTDLGDTDPQITTIADAVIKLKEIRESNKNLNEPDVEEQFARLSLAFKTDRFTLSKRLELQQRQRDIAEKNIDSELKSLRESLNALNQLCTDSDMREVITKTQQHVDIVQQTTMRMSSRAETFGAIQQEQRMNSAFETMLNYVEHLKLLYDKEHLELEEYRRLLAEHNLLPEEKAALEAAEDGKRLLLQPRSHSLSSSSKPEARSRLLSAVCLLTPNSESSLVIGGNNLSTPNLSPKSRRASMPVGPLSTSNIQTPLNVKLMPNESLGNLKGTTNTEKTTTFNTRVNVNESLLTPDVTTTDKVDHDKDCSLCDGSSSVLRGTNGKTHVRRLSYSSSLDEKEELPIYPTFPKPLEIEALPDSDEETDSYDYNALPNFCPLRWTIDKCVCLCHTDTILLRFRYFISASLATAALFSLVFTFLPLDVAVYWPKWS